MRLFLSGPMGTGKSTVAREIAHARGVPAIDLDDVIATAQGQTVAEIFAVRGERGFRALEAEHLQRIVADHTNVVVALGGGTVTQPPTRRWLLENGTLITLRAPVEVLLSRLSGASDRPLLAVEDRARTLRAIVQERRAAYAECHAVVDADAAADVVAERVMQAADVPAVVVALGERSYRVEIGAGVRHRLVDHLRHDERRTSAIVLVTDKVVGPLHGAAVGEVLRRAGLPVTEVILDAGESAKHIGSVQAIWGAALSAGVDRDAVVIGVGGGVVGDLAGFAAATILRGIGLVHVPTTLLAMVDSAIGGKTGFDTEQGKNLIGAFHQPRVVLSDTELLATLPVQERRAGLAEVVKSAWLAGEHALAALEADAERLCEGEPGAVERAVQMASRLKATIVSGDEHEGAERALLNLGHTVGHAIEASLGYQGMRHGEAVALGMVAACRLARTLGRPAENTRRMVSLLGRLGLPTDVDRYLTPHTLAFMGADKKRGAGLLKFIVPGNPGETAIVPLALDDISRRVVEV